MKNVTKLTFAFVGLIVFGLILSSPGYSKIDPNSAVLIWLFEEGSGDTVKDSSGNGNDGTLMNGPEWRDGKIGKGLEFDGTDDYVISSTANGVVGTALSECLWIKFNDFSTENMFGYITSSPGAAGVKARYFYFSTWTSAGAPFNHIHLGTLKTDGGWGRAIAIGKMFDKGEWYFVCGVIDTKEGFIKAYVNGELKNTSNIPKGDTPGTPSEIWVGGTPEGGRWTNGVIDEVAFFNVALTEDDIKSIMEGGLSKTLGIAAVGPSGRLTSTWGNIKNAD